MKTLFAFIIVTYLSVTSENSFARREEGLSHQVSSAQLTSNEWIMISEAYNLWKSCGDNIWPGWTNTRPPMVYITEDFEFAIGFDVVLSGFQPYTYKTPVKWKIQTRKRELKPDLNACFPIQGIPAVIMGRWETISGSPGEWVITAVHEMFHVYQLTNGGKEKIEELKLGSQTDANWWLNYPFPYKEKEVMSLIHLQSFLNYLAATMDNDEAGSCSGAAREAIAIYRNALLSLYYRYSKFQ